MSQSLVMTPRLQQAITLLQYNHQEMVAHVQEQLLENPTLDAATAREWGLVNEVVAEEQLEDHAFERAERLAAGAPSAIRWTKYTLNNWYRMMGPAFDASTALEMLGFAGPEVREGLASHLEKRKPVFTGK